MDSETNIDELGKLFKETVEENQTRKILEILNGCKSLEKAKAKELLKK